MKNLLAGAARHFDYIVMSIPLIICHAWKKEKRKGTLMSAALHSLEERKDNG